MKVRVSIHLWKEYRYKGPVDFTPAAKQKRLFRGKQREHVVQEAMNRLRDWHLSHFQFEGHVRASLRSGLCLHGHDWALADHEDREIVREALHRIGAERPSWAEGQEEYAGGERDERARISLVERVRPCKRCGTLFAPLTPSRPAFYCSWECVSFLAPQACAHCGSTFTPKVSRQKYCSTECGQLAQRTVEERQCLHCKSVFRPKNGNAEGEGFYCSRACAVAARAHVSIVKECEWCCTVYVAHGHKSRFCSPKCRQKSIDLRGGKWKPKVISPPVFDYVFRMAA